MAVFNVSYLLQGPLARVVVAGIAGLERKVFESPGRGPSQKIQDYMHLSDFAELVKQTKSVQEITHAHPLSLMTFTRDNQELILTSLSSAGGLEDALDLAGVKQSHFELWVKLADNYIEPFYTFIIECRKATAMLNIELKQKMRMGGWKGAEALYKLLHPEIASAQVGKAPTVQFNQVNNNNFTQKSPEEKRAVVDAWRNLQPPPKIIDVEPNNGV